ncbi:hypothetical protein ACFPT7_02205 [Acidicapsa dinghuensis]|uniref:Uncharacterized protein n=1 Tax=Acidicapsa dinghuensis TaxID=2218256 RepID=A0ABW1ECI2_9BACT|nr:hypothetical protein [Acidicapsa dinghuensis]
MPTYLDANGNPIGGAQAGAAPAKVYLDDNGNPVSNGGGSIDLSNKGAQGTYNMWDTAGHRLDIPYGQVPHAIAAGYKFDTNADANGLAPGEQYEKDLRAQLGVKDQSGFGQYWDRLTNPVGSGVDQGVVGGARQIGGQAIKAAAQPVVHPIDTLKGTAKFASDYATEGPASVGEDVVGPMVEQYLWDRQQGGHALAAENLIGNLLGMYEGGRVSGAGMRAWGGPAVDAALQGVGGGLRGAGEGIAESALGVRNVDRAFDASPGEAALEQTRGYKPSTIAAEAQQRLEDLQLERGLLAHANPGPVNFGPARQVASDAMQEQALRNAIPQIDRMNPLAEQIRTQGEPRDGWPIGVQPPRPAGRPIPPWVETPEALNLREGVGNYSADKPWTGKASADPLRGMVRGMYGSMSDSIHSAVPEIAPIDATMHDLIPVAQRASEVDLNANTLQRTFGRFARPTGALVGTVSGAAAGHAAGGGMGALLGGFSGLIAPEVLASPTFQMAIARTIYSMGKEAEAAGPMAAEGANQVVPAIVVGGGTQSPEDAEFNRLKSEAEATRPGFFPDYYLRDKARFNVARAQQDASGQK